MPDLTAVDFSGITAGMSAMIPIGIPVAIGIIAMRKGVGMLFSFFNK